MLSTNYNKNLLNLQDVFIKKIDKDENTFKIHIEMPVKEQICPHCKNKTKYIHGYRKQSIKDIEGYGHKTLLIYNKRRYRCKKCGKCFSERNTFLPKYHRMTSRLIAKILDKLRYETSFTNVAREVNLSVSTVIRIFDKVNYPKADTLPEVLAIDEFKGNTGGEKYNCILTDPKSGVVLDILESRKKYVLTDYFKSANRQNTKYFVSDMWEPYRDISKVFFKNAVQIVDKYHYVRQIMWALEDTRKKVQKQFSKSHRIYFKRSKSLLTKRYDKLTDEQKTQVKIMLDVSADLSTAYFMKEDFLNILNIKDIEKQKKELDNWILWARDCPIDRFRQCSDTITNWYTGISNSLNTPYTNGFTEGCNNKIKVLKRLSYGYTNFRRFRNRILHIFSNKTAKKINNINEATA